ncbi:MAG: recombinase [Chromatiaceae bacterium]|nr:recombinase [Chromatiaceae bacterium]
MIGFTPDEHPQHNPRTADTEDSEYDMHLRDYTDYEQEAERIRTENWQLIDGFKAWLAEGGLKEKTIGKHAANVAFYINHYLLYEDALRPPAGLEATGEFFNWFFPHKALWSSVATTKETVAGLKKFYRYLAETGVVETSAYEEFLAVVKRDLPEWLEHYRDFETW